MSEQEGREQKPDSEEWVLFTQVRKLQETMDRVEQKQDMLIQQTKMDERRLEMEKRRLIEQCAHKMAERENWGMWSHYVSSCERIYK